MGLPKREVEKVESKEVLQKKKELKQVARLRPQKGHTLYKVDSKTLKIELAVFKSESKIYHKRLKDSKGNPKFEGIKRVIHIEDGKVYFSALNEKNVIKKILKQMNPEIAIDLLKKQGYLK